jgi:hypothetical protein
MMPETTDQSERERFLNRYLLGQVSPEERDHFEDQYLSDDDLFEELVAAENDLVDAYVKGRLSSNDQKQFESYFLNSLERREQVDFAKALANYEAKPKPVPDSEPVKTRLRDYLRIAPVSMRFALAAMLLAIFAGLLWMVLDDFRLRREFEASRHQLEQLRQQVANLTAGNQQHELAQLDPPGSVRLSLVLAPVSRGGGQPNTIVISPGISTVAFRLNREREEYSSYGVALETVAGARILQKRDLVGRPAQNGKKVVTAEFESKSLAPGDYVLKLIGVNAGGKTEELSAYSFRVLK